MLVEIELMLLYRDYLQTKQQCYLQRTFEIDALHQTNWVHTGVTVVNVADVNHEPRK
jgi:hypothetical protein